MPGLQAQQRAELGRTLQRVRGRVVLPDRHAPGLDGQADLGGGLAPLLILMQLGGDVAEGDPQPLLERPHPHLDVRASAAGDGGDEVVGAALGHRDAISALEVRTDDVGHDLPERPAQRLAPFDPESLGGRGVQRDQPPLLVHRVEAIGQAVESGHRIGQLHAPGGRGETGVRPDLGVWRCVGHDRPSKPAGPPRSKRRLSGQA